MEVGLNIDVQIGKDENREQGIEAVKQKGEKIQNRGVRR